ncbi:MAG: hypothetical protein HW377_2443 [Actinobacteria bacterium]|nr:hypothetical protein [Actinomycetota bacterium]
MDGKESEALFSFIDQMIGTSEPRQAEYFRGYRRGIQVHVLGVSSDMDEHIWCSGSSGSNSGDQYLDAFARGYRDGCRGAKPEGVS